MSLDQMFALLKGWGERQTAFGQTAEVQRAAAKLQSSAEGRKADPEALPSRGVRVVLGTQLDRGIVPSPREDRSIPRGRRTDQGDAAAKDYR